LCFKGRTFEFALFVFGDREFVLEFCVGILCW
jgi:hypothetical protein